MSKKTFILVMTIVVVGSIALIFQQSVSTKESTILKNQIVDDLSFEDATLDYSNGVSTLTVKVVNTTNEDYHLKTITVKTEENEMLSYVGPVIKANDSVIMTALVDKDITNAKNLEYIVNR